MADEFDPDAYLGATATAPPPEFDPNQYLGIQPAGVAPPMLAAPEGQFPRATPVIPTALGATGFPYPQPIQPPLLPPGTPPTAAAEPDWTTGVSHYGGPMDLPEPTGEDFRGPFTSGAVQAAAKKAAETGLSYGPPILAARTLLPPENPIRQFAEATIGAGGQLASGLTSNENLAITAALIPTAGTAAAPLISNVFAAQMLSQAPELWQAFKDAPDFKSKVSVAEQAVGTLVLAGTAAAHGILGETAVPGAVGPARPQAEAPVQPPLEPPPAAIPPEYLRPAPPTEAPPAVEAGVSPAGPPAAPERLPRPTVPETPPEPQRGLSALDEIVQANARTTRQVQQLFPERGLSREEAAAFRRAAWGEAPPAAPPAAEFDPDAYLKAAPTEAAPPVETAGPPAVEAPTAEALPTEAAPPAPPEVKPIAPPPPPPPPTVVAGVSPAEAPIPVTASPEDVAIRNASDDQLRAQTAAIDAQQKPLYDKLEALGDDAFVKGGYQYTPEAQALHDQIDAAGSRQKQLIDFELKRREQQRANQVTLAKQEARVKGLPVYQRRNGWEIVKDEAHGQKYVVRDPFTGEEVYRHQNLNRVRQVADESSAGDAEDARRRAMAAAPPKQPTRLPPPPPEPPIVEAKPEIKAQARAVAKAPETAPQKMRVQKAYLLDALDNAHKDAPENAIAPVGDAEREALQASNPYRQGYARDYNASPEELAAQETARDAKQRAEVQPLIDKYGLTNFRTVEPGYLDYSMSEAPQWRAGVDRPATHEELIKELANRIDEARAKELPKITIEVPGDGTFDIVNTKEAIAKFRDEARKRFPTTLARAKEPTTGGRTTPEPIPAVGKPKTREDYIKIAGRAASQDETRFVLHKTVASTGDELVATDGRRLIRIDYKGPTVKETVKGKGKGKQVEVTKPAIFDADTGKPTKYKEKQEGNYPNWKQVVPDSSKLGTHKKVATLDTGALMKLVTQAEQMTSERNVSVKLWMDDKGKLGITSSTPDLGEFAGGDANPNTAKFLAALSPEFLKDGLRMARHLGHEKVDLHYQDELAPIVLKAKGMEYVQMPMRIDSGGGNYAAIHPAITDPGMLRTRTRADVFNELRGIGPGAALNEMEARGIPTDAMQAHQDRVNAALTMGRKAPHEDFANALRSDLEKWNPDYPLTAPVATGVSPAPKFGEPGYVSPAEKTRRLKAAAKNELGLNPGEQAEYDALYIKGDNLSPNEQARQDELADKIEKSGNYYQGPWEHGAPIAAPAEAQKTETLQTLRDMARIAGFPVPGGVKPPSIVSGDLRSLAPISEVVPKGFEPARNTAAMAVSRIQQIKDAVGTQSIPKSVRAGVGNEVIEHASARLYVPHLVRDLMARVFPDSYKDQAKMARTIDIINKDNVLGGYDDARGRLAELRQEGDEKAIAKQEQWINEIDDTHDLPAYDAEVKMAGNNPEIRGNIARWEANVVPMMDQLYNEMKGVDPATPRETRGRNFGARVNLLPDFRAAELAEWNNPEKPTPTVQTSNYRNPNVKRDPFARQARLTGAYSTDPELVLLNSFGGRWNEVTKLRLYNALEREGVAQIAEPGASIPKEIGGKPAARMAIKLPETNPETGITRPAERALFVQRDLIPELRTALDTDMRFTQHPIFKAITQLQLLQFADATAHNKNIHTVISSGLGRDAAWKDVATKIPFLSTGVAVREIAHVAREISADTPAIRREIADMSRKGMIRPAYPPTGVQKITKMQQLIHEVDTASRVIMNRRFDNLVRRGLANDTPIERRNFVQQIGEYNRRLMGRWEQTFRDKGLSPFIVAGRTFNRFSKRLITGDPGFTPKNPAAAVQARAAQLSTLAFATVVPAITNMFTTGSPFGRSGTSIGSIDFGPSFDTDDGKHRNFDVMQLVGIRRGLRALGLDAAINGIRNGESFNEIAGKALNDAITTAAHPWTGPGLGAAFQILTGRRLDLRTGFGNVEARNVGGAAQYLENARVALKQQNPLLYGLFSKVLGDDAAKTYRDKLVEGAVKSPLSALGYKETETPAMQTAHDINRAKSQAGGVTPDQLQRSQARHQAIRDIAAGLTTARQAQQQGGLAKGQVTEAMHMARMTPLMRQIFGFGAEDAVRVWKAADAPERQEIYRLVRNKIQSSKVITPQRQHELRQTIGPAPVRQ